MTAQGDIPDGSGSVPSADPAWREADRLAALDRYAILDTGREPAFDEVASLAADLLDTPIGVVNFIAADRQWFKAEVGIGRDEMPLDVSICRHAILQPGVLVVPDLALDPRFADNPLVTAAGGLRFYAGALLETPEGLPLGTVCVLDTAPRPGGVSPRQERALRALAAQTMAQLELRAERRRAEARERSLAVLLDTEDRLRDPAAAPAALIAAVCEVLGRYLRVDCVGYAEPDMPLENVLVRGGWAAPGFPAPGGWFRMDDHGPPKAAALRSGRTTRADDTEAHPLTRGTRAAAAYAALGCRAILDVPVMSGGRLAGILFALSALPRAWSDEDASLAEGVVARLRDALQRQGAEARTAEQAGLLARVAKGRPLEDCLTEVTAAVGRLLPGVRACILLPDPTGRVFERTFAADVPLSLRGRIHSAEIGEYAIGTCGVAVWAGRPVACPDISVEGPWAPVWRELCLAHGLRGCHSEPAIGPDGRAVASLALYFAEPRRLTAAEREVAEFAARVAAIAIGRDRADSALAGSEERHRLVVESARDFAIVTLDAMGVITGWNSGAERILGFTGEEAVGQPGAIFFTPEDRAAGGPEAELRRARETGRAENERWHLRKDGSRFWGSGLVRPFASDAGRGYVKIFQDRTAERDVRLRLEASQAALRRLNEELEARVRAEVAAREEAQARLAHAQRMEALGQLAGGIAHDFNNVLQAVSGGAKLIAQGAEDPARTRRLAAMVAEAAGRGAAVTRRLLAFSRRADLRAEAIDTADLLAGMREILAHTLGGGIQIRVQAPPGLPPLLADKAQLETALVNLAANARDAMDGNGTITLSAIAETVGPPGDAPGYGAPRPGRYVRLSVSDTGAGMDAATLRRATEPFFTTKVQGQGTGLGLAMARGFAEQSGGGLRVESAPGRGTTVRLWLPVTEADAEPRAAPHEDTAPRARGRVLLVDDEALVRTILAEGIEAAGFHVLSVGSSTEALELLAAREAVDALVSDLSMPGMDGLALIQEAQRRWPGLPAVLLTGFATDAAELALGGLLSGSFTLLRKPVDAAILADRVAMLRSGTDAGST